jgi:hypothetical protein
MLATTPPWKLVRAIVRRGDDDVDQANPRWLAEAMIRMQLSLIAPNRTSAAHRQAMARAAARRQRPAGQGVAAGFAVAENCRRVPLMCHIRRPAFSIESCGPCCVVACTASHGEPRGGIARDDHDRHALSAWSHRLHSIVRRCGPGDWPRLHRDGDQGVVSGRCPARRAARVTVAGCADRHRAGPQA